MIKIDRTVIYKNTINMVSLIKYLETFIIDEDILNKESFLEYEVNYLMHGKYMANDVKKMTSVLMIRNLLNHYDNSYKNLMKKINKIQTLRDIDEYITDLNFNNFILVISKDIDSLIEKILWIYVNDIEFIQNNIEKIKEMLFDKISKRFFFELDPQNPVMPPVKFTEIENVDSELDENDDHNDEFIPYEHLRSHVTLYEKYNLLGDVSLRYFYQFQDRPNLVNKWILKDHNSGTFTKLSESMVKALFENYKLEYGEYPTRHLIHGYQNEDETFYIHVDLLTGEEHGEKIEN